MYFIIIDCRKKRIKKQNGQIENKSLLGSLSDVRTLLCCILEHLQGINIIIFIKLVLESV